jgi:GNAT superfamily N-acetyltransferase
MPLSERRATVYFPAVPLADVTIRYLELVSRSALRAKRADRGGLTFTRVPQPMPELNRFFYAAIGGEWFWLERRPWTLTQWREYLANPNVETWVLSDNGIPAGYCELQKYLSGDVELMYFGLLGAFIGKGLGAHLLTEAVERAWGLGAVRVIVNTCNLDHPKALANYLGRGFREYRVEVQHKEVPGTPPGPWDGALDCRDGRTAAGADRRPFGPTGGPTSSPFRL